MLLARVVQVPIELSLVLIVFILLLCVIISLLRPRKADLKRIFGRTAELGLIPFRRLLVIENILDRADMPICEVMRERKGVRALRLDALPEENLRVVSDTRFSRYPIIEQEGGKPIGVLHVKDLALIKVAQSFVSAELKKLARPGLELREDLSVTKTMARFRRHSQQMGIVLNAKGEWTGIVTIEDLFEEIVGEIEDEASIARGESPLTLAESLTPGRVVFGLHAASTTEAIQNIIAAIPKEELPIDSQTIVRALMQSAASAATYLGKGVAVLPAGLEDLNKPMIAVARSEEGVDLSANEHNEIFFVALCSQQTPNVEARLLASITRLIESDYVLNRLRTAETPEEVIETIRTGEQVLPL